MGAMLGDANSPLTQITDKAIVAGAGASTAAQIIATDSPCTLVQITANEKNSEPIAIGSSAVRLGLLASSYSDRVGGIIVYPGQSVVIAVVNANLLYQSGLAADGFSWSILK